MTRNRPRCIKPCNDGWTRARGSLSFHTPLRQSTSSSPVERRREIIPASRASNAALMRTLTLPPFGGGKANGCPLTNWAMCSASITNMRGSRAHGPVRVHYENIKPHRASDYDWIPKTNWLVNSTPYDYYSIMHYRVCWASSCESLCKDGDGSSPCAVID